MYLRAKFTPPQAKDPQRRSKFSQTLISLSRSHHTKLYAGISPSLQIRYTSNTPRKYNDRTGISAQSFVGTPPSPPFVPLSPAPGHFRAGPPLDVIDFDSLQSIRAMIKRGRPKRQRASGGLALTRGIRLGETKLNLCHGGAFIRSCAEVRGSGFVASQNQ